MFAMSSGVSCQIAKGSRKNELLAWRKESSCATCNVGLSTQIGRMSSHANGSIRTSLQNFLGVVCRVLCHLIMLAYEHGD
jgi:hypothetical protein